MTYNHSLFGLYSKYLGPVGLSPGSYGFGLLVSEKKAFAFYLNPGVNEQYFLTVKT